MALFDRLLGRDGRLTPKLLADVLLMATLADGRLTEREVDALSWAVAHRPELSGLDWDWLIVRANDLSEDAPLFFDLRQRLAAELQDPGDRRLALTLANRVAGAHGPVAEEEQALLRSLAEAFEVGDAEQAELMRPSPPGSPTFTWRRTLYSDPLAPPLPYFDALAKAREPGDARILIHRLHALRALLDTRFGDAKLVLIGHTVPVNEQHLRIDGVLHHGGRTVWVKTLAVGEALFPQERKLLPLAMASRPEATDVFITHSGPLSPADRASLEAREGIELKMLKLS